MRKLLLAVPLMMGTAPYVMPSPYVASFVSVPRLDCGDARGTGVRLSGTLIITAAHVNTGRSCEAFGHKMTNLWREPKADIAYGSADMDDGFRAVVSCAGISEGERYTALGFPMGESPAAESLIGTGQKVEDGQVRMLGTVYPGMSGGAVLDRDGRLVAIINATGINAHYAYVTPLSATYLCRKSS